MAEAVAVWRMRGSVLLRGSAEYACQNQDRGASPCGEIAVAAGS